MTEKRVPVVNILNRSNGNRRMLEQILKKHSGLQINGNLAKKIISDELEKPEIYRKVTSGLGIPKSHSSGHKEGGMKDS